MSKSIQYVFSSEKQHPIFQYIDAPKNQLGDFDLEVQVLAISLNPVDYKVGSNIKNAGSAPKVLGWDVAGKILKVGNRVKGFSVDDEVYYAGDITRPGGNTQCHLVDSRIVAKKPTNLSFIEASALPLTTLTAWEGLFDCLSIKIEDAISTKDKSLLVIGGAGGVGSMVTQLAKNLTSLNVIVTSSKEESSRWCKKMGADYVINYKNDLKEELKKIGVDGVDYIFCTNSIDVYFDQFSHITNPFGRIVSIVEIEKAVNLASLKLKSISFSWEFMFTRSMFQTSDMKKQGEILAQVAKMIEDGKIKTTMNTNLGAMTPENLKKGHDLLLTGSTIGKIVLGALE